MILKFFKKNKLIITAFSIAIIGIILSYYISYTTPPMIFLQNYIYDFYFNLKNKIIKNNNIKNDDIVIVTINEDSLTNYVENKFIKWPWPRKLYADLSLYLLNKGAKAIIFNINFTSPDIDHHGIPGYGKANDDRFYNIIFNTKKVIIPFNIESNNQTSNKLKTLKVNNIDNFKNIKNYKSLNPPYLLYTHNNENFGYYNIETGFDDKIRNYIPFAKIDNENYPSLAAAAYLLTIDKNLPDSLHLDKNGSFKLNYYKINNLNNFFKELSFYSVFSDYLNESAGAQAEISAETYKNKVIFVGTTLNKTNIKNINIFNREVYPNVEIHALAYQNLINKDWIRSFPYYFEFPFYFILIFLLIYSVIKINSKFFNIILYLLILTLLFGLNFYFFIKINTISNTLIFITLFLSLNLLIILIFKYNLNYNKKEKLEKSVSSDKKLSTKTRNINASVLFIELDNFTKYIATNPPEKAFEALNIYIKKFTDITINNKGFIYKILENEIIILFGAPIPCDDHADMAVRTAFDCYNISKDLFKEYNLNIRMGINSGEIIIGNLDISHQKREYVAIGNCLKSSQNFKNLNKIFDTNILVGKDTKNLLKNMYTLDYLGEFILNKKNVLYEFYYFTEANKQQKERFKLMTSAYENNDISSFKRFISYFLEENSNFGPALFYIKHHKNNENNFGEPIKLISDN